LKATVTVAAIDGTVTDMAVRVGVTNLTLGRHRLK
jgi:hypothetical protein